MARRVTVLLDDDLTGGVASETVQFSIDDTAYVIDLTDANAEQLRSVLGPFTAAARRTTPTPTQRAGTPPTARRNGGRTTDREQNRAIRTWARKHGYPVSDRGRIPQEIVDEFDAKAGRTAS